jgi:hypothetical protein
MLEENPLRVKKCKENRDYSKYPGGADGEIAKQMQLMEKKYTVFDYNHVGPESERLRKTPQPSTDALDNIVKKSKTDLQESAIVPPRELDPHEISMHDLTSYKDPVGPMPGMTVGPTQAKRVLQAGSVPSSPSIVE